MFSHVQNVEGILSFFPVSSVRLVVSFAQLKAQTEVGTPILINLLARPLPQFSLSKDAAVYFLALVA